MNAIIMAGGSGTRFWPASRAALPKQFLRITGERTMLEETIARIEPVVPSDRVSVIVGKLHEEISHRLLGDTAVKVMVEPFGRNTAACIGLAALHWRRRDPGVPLVVLPADHFIADRAAFTKTLAAAAKLAATGSIVTLGILPTRPETGYGYIQAGEKETERPELPDLPSIKGVECCHVTRFVEKPDLATAIGYLESGQYLWNSGIFLFTPETILAEIEAHLPLLAEGLAEIDRVIGRDEYQAVLDRVYAGLPSVSIDHGIMEKTRRPLYVIRSEFGWSDVGSWQALYELRRGELTTQTATQTTTETATETALDSGGNLLLGPVWTEDSRNNLVYSTTGRQIALLGVEGLAIIDTGDTLMVADMSRSQEVKLFAEREKAGG
jgi:mannose-1-phosphate guanylyltransferase